MPEVTLPKVLGRSSDLCCVVAVLLFAAAVKTKRLRTNRGAAPRPLPGPLFLMAMMASSVAQAMPLFVPGDSSVRKLMKMYAKLQRKSGDQVSTVNIVLHMLTTDASAFQLMLRVFFLVITLTMVVNTLTGMITGSTSTPTPANKEAKAAEAKAPSSPVPAWLRKAWPSLFAATAVALLAATIKGCSDDGTLGPALPDTLEELSKIVKKCLPRQSGMTAALELLAIGPQMLFLDDAFTHGIALRLVACGLLLAAWHSLGQLNVESFSSLNAVSQLQRLVVLGQTVLLVVFFLPVYLRRSYSVVLGFIAFAVFFAGLWIVVSEGLPSVQAKLGDYGDTGKIIQNALNAIELQQYDTMTIGDAHRYLSVFCVACVLCCAIVGGSTALMVSMGLAALLSRVHVDVLV